MKRADVPKFGPLAGVKVISVGVAIAGPYAASLMADFGAEVMQIENASNPEISRITSPGGIEQERRNEIMIGLNIPSPEGREVFFKLLKDADIFIENGKGGQWVKWGLSDEVLWEINPKLVICHVSGFGQTGHPDYIGRGSWDSIGQAFGGYMILNGEPEPGLPAPANVLPGDYLAALHASWACLAAYINVQRTGIGESIDCAQFEAVAKAQHGYATDTWNFGIPRKRGGARGATGLAGWGPFKCKDGYLYVCFNGVSCFRDGLKVIGLEYGSERFPEGTKAGFLGTPDGEILDEAVRKYCEARTVAEAEDELNKNSVPASPVIDSTQMLTNPHYQARGTVIEWENTSGKQIKGIKVVPDLKNAPGKVWRGACRFGEDNEDILEELGYSQEQIAELYAKKVLGKKAD